MLKSFFLSAFRGATPVLPLREAPEQTFWCRAHARQGARCLSRGALPRVRLSLGAFSSSPEGTALDGAEFSNDVSSFPPVPNRR